MISEKGPGVPQLQIFDLFDRKCLHGGYHLDRCDHPDWHHLTTLEDVVDAVALGWTVNTVTGLTVDEARMETARNGVEVVTVSFSTMSYTGTGASYSYEVRDAPYFITSEPFTPMPDESEVAEAVQSIQMTIEKRT